MDENRRTIGIPSDNDPGVLPSSLQYPHPPVRHGSTTIIPQTFPDHLHQQGYSQGRPSYNFDQSESPQQPPPYSLNQSEPPQRPPSYSTNQPESSQRTLSYPDDAPRPVYPEKSAFMDASAGTSTSHNNQPSLNYGTGSPTTNSYQQPSHPALIPPPMGAQPSPENEANSHRPLAQKSIIDTYLLALVFGLLGAHHFYLRRYGWGILYLFTFGLIGCGYIIDLFRVPYLVKKFNRKNRPNNSNNNNYDLNNSNYWKKKKDLSDAYVAWLPFGLLGFHHYYLGNYRLGIIFTLTLGIFGLGWLIDFCRMPHLVKQANNRLQFESLTHLLHKPKNSKSLCICYILALPPMGWLGIHHFYMNRPFYGYAYILSLAELGTGWFIDLFRMPALLRRCNEEIALTRKRDVKTVDDCYVMWFPFGLIGFHHYYLGRVGWGVLYTLTFGLLGLGWLIDSVRIPLLVKEANRARNEEEERLISDLRQEPRLAESLTSPPNSNQNFYHEGYHNNGYGNNNDGYISNSFDHNSNDIMRLPGNGVLNIASAPVTPPDYSFHHNSNCRSDCSKNSITESGGDVHSSPPPYKE